MIREQMVGVTHGEKNFRWRGGEISRVEGFSDAVFAFAVTLLVVSLEVPKSFHDLMQAMRGFPAFAICFAILANVWFEHYRFFRRYGLQDGYTIFVNCVLLFFLLLYVYPLKFVFSSMFDGVQVQVDEARKLFEIYSAGFAAVYFIFSLLYWHAWKFRDALGLSPLEKLKTQQGLADHVAMTVIGLTSILLAWALPPRWVGLAGWLYFGIGLYYTAAGTFFGRRETKLLATTGDAPPIE
jgi:uncharacterized membrane protein